MNTPPRLECVTPSPVLNGLSHVSSFNSRVVHAVAGRQAPSSARDTFQCCGSIPQTTSSDWCVLRYVFPVYKTVRKESQPTLSHPSTGPRAKSPLLFTFGGNLRQGCPIGHRDDLVECPPCLPFEVSAKTVAAPAEAWVVFPHSEAGSAGCPSGDGTKMGPADMPPRLSQAKSIVCS